MILACTTFNASYLWNYSSILEMWVEKWKVHFLYMHTACKSTLPYPQHILKVTQLFETKATIQITIYIFDIYLSRSYSYCWLSKTFYFYIMKMTELKQLYIKVLTHTHTQSRICVRILLSFFTISTCFCFAVKLHISSSRLST